MNEEEDFTETEPEQPVCCDQPMWLRLTETIAEQGIQRIYRCRRCGNLRQICTYDRPQEGTR